MKLSWMLARTLILLCLFAIMCYAMLVRFSRISILIMKTLRLLSKTLMILKLTLIASRSGLKPVEKCTVRLVHRLVWEQCNLRQLEEKWVKKVTITKINVKMFLHKLIKRWKPPKKLEKIMKTACGLISQSQAIFITNLKIRMWIKWKRNKERLNLNWIKRIHSIRSSWILKR